MAAMRYFLLFLVGILPIGLHAYNHQGFEVFLEKDSSMRFACKNQCAVEIMAPIQGDGINLSTKNAKGTGVLAVGVVDGSRFYPLFPISLGTTSHRIAFNEIPNFQYLPKTARIFLVAEGTIEVDSFEAIPYIMSNFEFLQSLLKQWLQIDDFRAYSINIFYGPIIFGEFLTGILLQYTSITLGFLIFLLYIFPGVPQKYYRNTIIGILLTSWILLQIPTDRRILSYGWSDFMAGSRSKEYLDRGTLHLDTRQAREILKNHTGSAILLTDTPWPYFVNFNYELAPRRILGIDALKEGAGQPIILYATRRAEIQGDTLVFSGKTIGKGVFVPFESGGPGGIFLQR